MKVFGVSEVVMKFNSWRRRSYPVEIKVGDKVVLKGQTPRSLGYVTFPFQPVSGESLTVQLVGSAVNEDAYNIVEITGQKDFVKDGFKEKEAPEDVLSIIEIEIYEKTNL